MHTAVALYQPEKYAGKALNRSMCKLTLVQMCVGYMRTKGKRLSSPGVPRDTVGWLGASVSLL